MHLYNKSTKITLKEKSMKFRADIQIIRGLSVLLVVLFHLGFSVFKSGFLGVDIFFVISGFLMAVLYDGKDKTAFFKRRAIRLLPAYYTIILATLLVSFLTNTPNETGQVVEQAIFASIFSSNIGFWMQNSYFSTAEFNPLLHLWSLGVEIQFYLIVPLLAWFFSKNKYLLIASLLTSLLLCLLMVGISPKTSFFMMPLRIWEFLIGYSAAALLTDKGNVLQHRNRFIGLFGVILVVLIPFFNVDGQSLSIINGHPGLFSILISLSTGLVLVFGLPRKVEISTLGKSLTGIGKYSYSIYLVHFPIIVLYLSKPFSGTSIDISEPKDLFIIILLICISSFLLYRYVETRKFKINIFKLSLGASATIIVTALLLPIIQSSIIPAAENNIFKAFKDRSTYRCGKLHRVLEPNSISCELTGLDSNINHNIMLVGNSHADSIKTTFAEIAKKNRSTLHFITENTPLTKGGLSPERILKEAKSKKITHIVLHHSPMAFSYEIIEEIVSIAEIENINVVFIEPVPIWSEHIPQKMYGIIKNKDSELYQSRKDYLEYNSMMFNQLDKIENKNFSRTPIVDYFCNPECIYKTEDGTPIYFDRHHLTLTGSRLISDAIQKTIEGF